MTARHSWTWALKAVASKHSSGVNNWSSLVKSWEDPSLRTHSHQTPCWIKEIYHMPWLISYGQKNIDRRAFYLSNKWRGGEGGRHSLQHWAAHFTGRVKNYLPGTRALICLQGTWGVDKRTVKCLIHPVPILHRWLCIYIDAHLKSAVPFGWDTFRTWRVKARRLVVSSRASSSTWLPLLCEV